MSVKMTNIDLGSRIATFEVNGDVVQRPISVEVTDETLEEHLIALANGLAVEFPETNNALTKSPFENGHEF